MAKLESPSLSLRSGIPVLLPKCQKQPFKSAHTIAATREQETLSKTPQIDNYLKNSLFFVASSTWIVLAR
jgi:hypothetical protein